MADYEDESIQVLYSLLKRNRLDSLADESTYLNLYLNKAGSVARRKWHSKILRKREFDVEVEMEELKEQLNLIIERPIYPYSITNIVDIMLSLRYGVDFMEDIYTRVVVEDYGNSIKSISIAGDRNKIRHIERTFNSKFEDRIRIMQSMARVVKKNGEREGNNC